MLVFKLVQLNIISLFYTSTPLLSLILPIYINQSLPVLQVIHFITSSPTLISSTKIIHLYLQYIHTEYLQNIHTDMQADLEIRSSAPSLFVDENEEEEFAEIAAKISEDFDFKLSFLKLTSEQQGEESEDAEEDHHEDVVADDDDDFTFAINGSDSTEISGEGVSADAPIRPYFPLFNQNLLLATEDYKKSENRLPSRPPVEKVFIESPPSEGETNAVKTYCEWEKTTPELSKKSNSTGFSKLWRFKEYLHRSHSDGRDAFVFFNNEVKRELKSVQKKVTGEASSEKKPEVKVAGEKKAVTVKKGKKTAPPLSAHEVYLRSKGIYPDYDRRRSHLPFQPVGFFTNVSGGGLSKNVHPY